MVTYFEPWSIDISDSLMNRRVRDMAVRYNIDRLGFLDFEDRITTLESSGGGGNSFTTIAVSGQSDVVADSATDTLTLVAGDGISITTDASTDEITVSNTMWSYFPSGF